MAFPFARYVVGTLILACALCIQVWMTGKPGATNIWMDMSWARLSDELWGNARKHKLVARSLSDTGRQEVQPDQVLRLQYIK